MSRGGKHSSHTTTKASQKERTRQKIDQYCLWKLNRLLFGRVDVRKWKLRRLGGFLTKLSKVMLCVLSGFAGGWWAVNLQSAQAEQTEIKTVCANQFQLINTDGKLQASMVSGTCPIITLYKGNGSPGLVLSTMNDRPYIFCMDATGHPSLSLGVDKFGKPEVSLGSKENQGLKLFYSPENTPTLMIMNSRSQAAAMVTVDKDGSGSVVLGDGHGNLKFLR